MLMPEAARQPDNSASIPVRLKSSGPRTSSEHHPGSDLTALSMTLLGQTIESSSGVRVILKKVAVNTDGGICTLGARR